MTTTDNAAKTYLMEFVARNPQILQVGFSPSPAEMTELLSKTADPNNWEMWGPRRPTEDDEFPEEGYIGVYDEGVTPNPYLEATSRIPTKQVAMMRYFSYTDPMSDMGFNLLELSDGSFRCGTLTDCWPD